MGVGCEEAGVCYAAAHNQPERCGRMDKFMGCDIWGLYKDAIRWRKLVKASEQEFPPITLCLDPENEKFTVYGKKNLEDAIAVTSISKRGPCKCCNGTGKVEVELTEQEYMK